MEVVASEDVFDAGFFHERLMQVQESVHIHRVYMAEKAEGHPDLEHVPGALGLIERELQNLINEYGKSIDSSRQSVQEAIDTHPIDESSSQTESAPILKLVEDLDDTRQ